MKRLLYKSNQITILRVLLIPIFVLFLLSDLPYMEYFAAFIFIMLSLSDALDGYIARKRKEVTSIGKIIDPISDKLLIGAALIFLIGKGIDAWMVLVILLREVLITVIRLIALARGVVIAASKIGKLKTISQIVGILMIILNIPGGWYVMLFAVIITLVSGINYLIKAAYTIEEKIVNIPNIITSARLLLIPLYMVLIFWGWLDKAILVLILIGLGDKLDGFSARIMKQTTKFGKIYDSFTDWTFVVLSFLTFFIVDLLPSIWLILILIPSIVNGVIKLFYLKKDKDVVLVPIAQAAVAMMYLSIGMVLFRFQYQDLFLSAMIFFAYLAMFRYLYLFAKRYKKNKKSF